MKNLDLNAYGVEEMTQQETLNENGGITAIPGEMWIGTTLYSIIIFPGYGYVVGEEIYSLA